MDERRPDARAAHSTIAALARPIESAIAYMRENVHSELSSEVDVPPPVFRRASTMGALVNLLGRVPDGPRGQRLHGGLLGAKGRQGAVMVSVSPEALVTR
ncbi:MULTISPECIES: hypothetical protein [unclassified Nonomuraea]|uniref:hypothetical protein n=1 Tax=unclassified Nonomuraea TaxID=2593643 RepID=UPI0033F3F108